VGWGRGGRSGLRTLRRPPGSVSSNGTTGSGRFANAGKTSLFNALTGAEAAVAPHPFTTTETTVAAALCPMPAWTPWPHELEPQGRPGRDGGGRHRRAGPGASTGEGLGNRFLAGIREVDALVWCCGLRGSRGAGDTDPVDALATLELELVLADMATVETQLDKRRRAAKSDKSLAGEIAAMERASKELSGGCPCTGRVWTRRPGRAQEPLPAHHQARAGRGEPG